MQITNLRSYAVSIDGVVAGPGETIDVSDEIGTAALEQSDAWGEPTKRAKSTKSADDGEKESAS